MPKRLNLAGQRFGRLEVLRPDGNDKYGAVMWLCRCECGATTTARGSQIRRGVTASCGCGIAIKSSEPRKHGQTGSPLWVRWMAMRGRCENPNKSEYANYGGRGIKVCDRWKEFEAFAEDMAAGFNKGLEIDRIDNDGNYEPGNCRWATRSEQARNQRRNHRVAWRGRILTVQDWAEMLGIRPNTLVYRLKRGWSIERALTTGASPNVLLELANPPRIGEAG